MQTTDEQEKHHHAHDVRFPRIAEEPAVESRFHSSLRVTSDHEAKRNTEADALTMAPRWALCPLDWSAHAIDAWADHPPGVWIARCGHQLSGGTPLYDVPQGQECPSCARWSQASEPRTTQ
jgi:hypothetical protein